MQVFSVSWQGKEQSEWTPAMPNTSGIYMVTNKLNGFTYIGKSARSCERRMTRHRKDARDETGSVVSRAIRKHGAANFDFDILCSGMANEDALNWTEKFLVKLYKDAGLSYNMTDGGEGVCGLVFSDEHKRKLALVRMKPRKPMSAEARKNVGDATRGRKHGPRPEHVRAAVSLAQKGRKRTPEQIAKHKLAITGRKATDEQKAKAGAAARGRKMPPRSAETRAKLSAAATGRKQPPCSDELRAKRSAAMTGRKLSEETRAKLRAAHARRKLAKAALAEASP
jgi:group I intron endonuclease